MKMLDQKERDMDALDENVKCICGENKAIGSWGLRVGHAAPFGYTLKMPYCMLHLHDMIDGLELVVKDLKYIRNQFRKKEGKSPL
jgi:hypothetical protein